MPLALLVAIALAQTRDLRGNLVTLPSADGVQAYIFELRDCPLANAFSPEINRLVGLFQKKGVKFAMVYVDSDGDSKEAAKHIRDYRLKCPVYLDPKQSFASAAGITHSPEAAVYRGTSLLYRGRINDLYATPSIRKQKATTADLADALATAIARKHVKQPRTVAVGCLLPRP